MYRDAWVYEHLRLSKWQAPLNYRFITRFLSLKASGWLVQFHKHRNQFNLIPQSDQLYQRLRPFALWVLFQTWTHNKPRPGESYVNSLHLGDCHVKTKGPVQHTSFIGSCNKTRHSTRTVAVEDIFPIVQATLKTSVFVTLIKFGNNFAEQASEHIFPQH